MSKSMQLDDFLSAQSSGFTATLEAIPDKPTYVKVTPFRDAHGCGCKSSIELPREAIRSVSRTGNFHFCCGKRLEIAIVEFAEDATIPVADLLKQREQGHDHAHGHDHGRDQTSEREWHGGPNAYYESMGHGGPRGYEGFAGHTGYGSAAFARSSLGGGSRPPHMGPGGPVGLVGRWRIPWSRCSVSCIEVCTRFCSDFGWDCCGWETRCALNCDGPYWDPLGLFD